MESSAQQFPEDFDELRGFAIRQSMELERYRRENAWFREQLRLLKAQMFGPKSEKYPYLDPDVNQLSLLLDLAVSESSDTQDSKDEDSKDGDSKDEGEDDDTKVGAHVRRKPGRRLLPESLPREKREHDVSEAEKICGCGAQKCRIGEETSEQLEYQPAKLFVVEHVRPKYACRKCEGAGNHRWLLRPFRRR